MANRWAVMISGVVGAVVLAGCAATGAAPAGDTTTVPELVGNDAAVVDKVAASAGVVAVVEREAPGQHKPGTVVRVEPAPGTAVARGSTVTVVVAGPAGGTVDEIVAADRRTFVGVGIDKDGTTIIAIGPDADEQAALDQVRPALAGRKHEVRRCTAPWADLSRIVTEVTRREDLKAGQGFGIAVDPALCAVKVTGDIPAEAVQALREQYKDTIVVEPGAPAARLPRR
ncbi:PASTA domain-containing protein [Actinoplanes sp. NPDC049118]|uniref:PASTA domain-containing protein n=1 Tax=Actinoplanes sp. NPDC049118 TaxID=3155769 RepID=UPI0033FAB2AE